MRLDVLAAILEQLYADRAFEIERKNLMKYARASIHDIPNLQAQLAAWQAEGKIEILKMLGDCDEMEPCIRLLGFILDNPNRNI